MPPVAGLIASHGKAIVTDSLLMNFDTKRYQSYSGSGTTWNDISGNNRHLTLTGSPTFTSNYLEFNGTSQYATFAATSNISISSVSIFMWIYPLSDGTFLSLQGQQAINTGYHHVCMDILSTGVFRVGLWNGTAVSYVSSTAQSFNRWHHLGLTYSGTTMTGYLNGTSLGSPAAFTWSPPSPLYFGLFANSATIITGGVNAFGHGRINRLNIYSKALTTAEIGQNFYSGRLRFNI